MKVDENRPSASEQAAKDDRNRQNVKGKDPALTSQSGQAASRAQQSKETKSAFDLVLESITNPALQSQSEAAKFDAKIKDALKDQEKDRDRASDRKSEKKDDDKKSSSGEKEVGRVSKEGAGRDKVLGKQNMGQGGSGGGSSGSEDKGGSSGQFGGRSSKQTPLTPAGLAAQGMQGVGRPEATFSTKMAGQVPREIPKAVMDQIVQHVRVGLNKNLDKEIHLDLSEKIFRGLSLKVSSRNGQVEVTFLTRNADVRRFFESQKGEIGQSLEEKGIAVSKIQVQYLG